MNEVDPSAEPACAEAAAPPACPEISLINIRWPNQPAKSPEWRKVMRVAWACPVRHTNTSGPVL